MPIDLVRLRSGSTLADGAWATQLWARGLPARVPPETANLSHPDTVLGLAREYLEAGARFLLTNTFCANRIALARRGAAEDAAAVSLGGARLARQAVDEQRKVRPAKKGEPADVQVVGVIGPTGSIFAVHETPEESVANAFREQAAALAEGGADAILLETFSELAEILLALRVVRETTRLPVIASMSFDSGPQRTRTMMGAEAAACAAALDDAGADVIGCNCGAGVTETLPVVVALRSNTQRPLWVKPNAGAPELEDGRPVHRRTPDEFAEPFSTLIEAGANIVGGCCGTGPEHIRRLATLLESRARAARR